MQMGRAQQEELQGEALQAAGAAAEDDDDLPYDEREEAGWEEEVEELEVDEADEALLAKLMPADTGARRTLADVILEKIAEHTAAGAAKGAGTAAPAEPPMPQVPEKVVQVYSSIGELLRRYRSGKLPKAFKIVPKLTNWEEVLFLTQPQFWSPQACAAATRIFASSLNPRMAQRFYALVLLPATLDDIDDNKRLNYHYYMALKKAVYKPAAFFKGIVLPMCEERCSLRHALIVCSVLSKVSVPAAHSAVTLLKLTEMPLSGAQMLFLRTLLQKKYALPYRLVDALADYFAQFGDFEQELPVIWHQSLLIFAQHYKMELTREQKEELKPVLRKHLHEQITAEIRRELYNSACRGDPYIPEVDMVM
jgi:essential nuclear protein 1